MDMQALKAKLEALKNGGGNRRTWKPKKDGELSTIRLVPYPHSSDPFVEMWFHYGVGKGQGILCPKHSDARPCAICEFATELWQSNDESSQEIAKKLFPRQRAYAVVVDREDETPTPKFWGFGKTVYQQLLEKLIEGDYRHYMDVDKGIDITVKSEKKGGKLYPETSITFKRDDTPLADSPSAIKTVLEQIVPIEEVFKPTSATDIEKRLAEHFGPRDEAEAEEMSSESVRGGALDEDDKATVMSDVDVEAELAAALEKDAEATV